MRGGGAEVMECGLARWGRSGAFWGILGHLSVCCGGGAGALALFCAGVRGCLGLLGVARGNLAEETPRSRIARRQAFAGGGVGLFCAGARDVAPC